MTKSWMTTTSACISAAASFILFAQFGGYYTFPKLVFAFAMFCSIGGMAFLGITAKDAGVTGGTRGQPSTPEALAIANQAPSTVNPPVPTPPIIPPGTTGLEVPAAPLPTVAKKD